MLHTMIIVLSMFDYFASGDYMFKYILKIKIGIVYMSCMC